MIQPGFGIYYYFLSFSKISSLKITYVALSLLKPPPLFDGLGAHLIAPIPYFSFVV
jgi:hypothetical protein